MSGARLAKRSLTLGLALVSLVVLTWAGVTLIHSQEMTTLSVACPFLRAGWPPIIVSLGFWLLALASEWFERRELALLLFVFSTLVSFGRAAACGSPVAAQGFYLLLLAVAPLVYRLHQGLLVSDPGCFSRVVLLVLVALSLVLAVPLVLWPFARLQAMEWFYPWRVLARVPFLLSMFFSISLIGWYRAEGWPEARLQHIRLVALGLAIGVTPMVSLTWLPNALGLPVCLPYWASAIGLLVTPLMYLRATVAVSPDLDRRLQQVVVSYLALLVAAGMMVAVGNLLAAGAGWTFEIAVAAVLTVSVALWLSWRPVWRLLVRLTTRVWEGKGASYPRVVGRLSESLAATLDPWALRRILIHRLARAMRFSWSTLFIRDESQMLAPRGSHGLAPTRGMSVSLPRGGAIAGYVRRVGAPVSHQTLGEAMCSADLDVSERSLLALKDARLWVPLIGGGVMHGVLLIGPKQGGDTYAQEDIEILTTLAGQAGVAVHNARLMEQVAAGRQELGRAHQRLLEAVELERRRLARELHDVVIQQIIGVSYQVAAGQRICERSMEGDSEAGREAPLVLEQVREGLLDVVSQLRGLCGDLRPAGLEELGLTAALTGYVARVERDREGSDPEIRLALDTGEAILPERVALILFRVAQEGLNNALRHSGASLVTIEVSNYGGYAEVVVTDDGKGFVVPDRLSELATQDHYGLVSMSERVAQVGGMFRVDSAPGEGTVIRAQIPLGDDAKGEIGDDSSRIG